MRLYMPLIFIVLFVGWALYHLLVKKDLHRYKTEAYAGLFFILVWGLIYYWIEN
ncbi:hypothetical protein [Flavobacterium sp. XGLA_31]|uniref:hypothetical protein n=1 Tax=Flavobacterium sp. XGLA_31 TaxID=3447666 RepID=UPI003F3F60D9